MDVKRAITEWQRVLVAEARAMDWFASQIETSPTLKTAIESALTVLQQRLDMGGQVLVLGLGKSGKIAQKIASTLASTGTRSTFLHPTEALHGDLGMAHPNDVAWAISHSGNTPELVAVAEHLKHRGVVVIGQGGNAKSALAQVCDLWIDTPIEREACPLELAPTTSTTLALAIGDGLAAALMSARDFDRRRFLENHPGGTLGRRLKTKVQDWMWPLTRVGLVERQSPTELVITQATEFKSGAVLVVDSIQAPRILHGVITDGDIRRALRHKDRFFSMQASDFMTSTPVVIAADASPTEAIRSMEDRQSQIHVLPVVASTETETLQPLGLLRLHDLIENF